MHYKYYRCNLVPKTGRQCASRLKSTEDQTKIDFVIEISIADHDHDEIETNSLKPAIRDRIVALNTSNREFTAKKIHNIFKAENMLPLPTVSEIQSRISYHCQLGKAQQTEDAENEIQDATNEVIITIGDVVQWAHGHKFNSDLDDDTPFVIDLKASEFQDKEKHFQYVFSTKRLLRNASNCKNICVDATYKVLFNGYPLQIMGSIDANRRFHLLAASLCVSETTKDFEFFFEGITICAQLIDLLLFMPFFTVYADFRCVRSSFQLSKKA